MGCDKRSGIWFAEVPADEVREPVRQAAMEMLAHVQCDLGLRGLMIRWFRCGQGRVPKEIRDQYLFNALQRGTHGIHDISVPRLIWVRATLSPFTAALVVARAARHAWQWLRSGRDATQYENGMIPLATELEKKHKRRKGKMRRSRQQQGRRR